MLSNLRTRFERQLIYVSLGRDSIPQRLQVWSPWGAITLRGLMAPHLTLWQTYIGSILVSVNPYRIYNIYGTEQVLQYEGRALGENPP